MRITVNGEAVELPEGIDAGGLVAHVGLEGQRIALEVNREIVPRGEYAQTKLHDGDEVEIVRAIGGG